MNDEHERPAFEAVVEIVKRQIANSVSRSDWHREIDDVLLERMNDLAIEEFDDVDAPILRFIDDTNIDWLEKNGLAELGTGRRTKLFSEQENLCGICYEYLGAFSDLRLEGIISVWRRNSTEEPWKQVEFEELRNSDESKQQLVNMLDDWIDLFRLPVPAPDETSQSITENAQKLGKEFRCGGKADGKLLRVDVIGSEYLIPPSTLTEKATKSLKKYASSQGVKLETAQADRRNGVRIKLGRPHYYFWDFVRKLSDERSKEK